MEILKINDTPVRTSRNFKINNIQLENIMLPNQYIDYTGFQIDGNVEVENDVKISNFKYGLGNVMQKNIDEFANNKVKVHAKGKTNITFKMNGDNPCLISYLEIVADGDADVSVKYSSETNHSCFVSVAIKLIAKEKSNVNISIANLLNEESDFFLSIENYIEDESSVKYTIADIGADNSVQNYYSNINGENAKNSLEAIYIGREKQIKDINYIAELYGKKSNVNIDVQGALKDNAKKNFKGTIDFKKGCKKAKGDENEYCMLLSDKAKSIALPMLLCTEDDVEGNHSTASGKLDDKELFYIMSRGIEKKDAAKLLVKARFNKILEGITNEELKNEIIYEIDRRLD